MRVLLVSSYTMPYVSRVDKAPPLSLLYLAAVLRQGGHEPVILDLNTVPIPDGESPESVYLCAVLDKLDAVRPGLVGLNCLLSAHFPFVRKAAEAIKEHRSETWVAVGGVHPTLFAQDILRHCHAIDAIALGEGERQVLALADAAREADRARLSNVGALAFRKDAGEVVVTPRNGYVDPLDELPMPAWDLVRFSDYYTDHSNWYNPRGLDIKMSAPILTSRSCPYDCNFCSAHAMMGRGLRRHGPLRVVDEMQMLHEHHGVNYFGFVDDNLTLNRKHILSICDEIVRRKMVIQFESFNGYNLRSIDEEIIDALVQAGCVYVILPIEHGSDYMRNAIIGKRLPRDQIYRVAELYRKHKLLTRGVFIMGFAEDTTETLNETLTMIQELRLDMNNVFNLIPFPGTRVFEQAVRDGLLLDDVNPNTLWRGTEDLNAVQNRFYIRPYQLTLDELQAFRHRFDELSLLSDRVRKLQQPKVA